MDNIIPRFKINLQIHTPPPKVRMHGISNRFFGPLSEENELEGPLRVTGYFFEVPAVELAENDDGGCGFVKVDRD
jgi:hypothetical protein